MIKHLNKDNCNAKRGEDGHPCSQCTAVFKFRYRLTEHVKSRQPENEKICTSCNKVFKRKDHFEKHVKKCSVLTPSFAINQSLANDLAECVNELEYEDITVHDNGSSSFISFIASPPPPPFESIVDVVDRFGYELLSSTILDDNETDNDTASSVPYLISSAGIGDDMDVNKTLDDSLHSNEINDNDLSSPQSIYSDKARAPYHKDYRSRKRKEKRLEDIVQILSSPVKTKVVKNYLE